MKRALIVLLFLVAASVTRSTSLAESPFCAGALHAQAQGEPVMPPEGNPDHVEPPKDAFCDHSSRPAHACACHAKCVEGDDGQVHMEEDGVHCRAFCFKKHCHCPADNCQAPAPSKLKARLKTVADTAEGGAVVVGTSYVWYLLTHGHR